MSFYEIIKKYPYEFVVDKIYSATEQHVINALNKNNIDENDLTALLSPSAESCIEQMAEISHNITLQRFGKTIKLYAPIYLSNYCTNGCVYCGFNHKNKIPRVSLTLEQVKKEAEIVAESKIQNVILVTGDNMKKFSFDMLLDAVSLSGNLY